MTRQKRAREERNETNRALNAERDKTDRELKKNRAATEKQADAAVAVARSQVDASLDASREQADAAVASASVPANVKRAVEDERVTEDRALAAQRNREDEELSFERSETDRALRALLHLEREATDQRLSIERARLDAEIVARDDFLAMVSHDLRTLLGGIALQAAILARKQPDDARGRETLRATTSIQRSTARMNRLIGDLIDVVSIEAGKLHIEPESHEATQLLRDTVEAFSTLATANGIELTTEMQGGALLAKFDHDRILQVLANLISNAIKFTEEGGTIRVRVSRGSNAEILFAVTDTGVGIPPERLPSIFERFWQSSTIDRRGLGLGLFISKCIVEAHGGRIWAESTPGRGSSFFFTLPAATE